VLASVVLLRIAAFQDAAASRRGSALASLETAPENFGLSTQACVR